MFIKMKKNNFMKGLKIIVIFSMMISIIPVKASSSEDGLIYYPHLTKIGELEKGPVIIIDGQQNETYWQFVNVNEALEDLENTTPIIEALKIKYELDLLNEGTWKNYLNALNEEIYVNGRYDNSLEEVVLIRECFDVCDNNDLNSDILSVYNSGDYSLSDLAILLPYNSYACEKYLDQKKLNIKLRAVSFDVTKAVNYATQYAESLNGDYKYFLGSDCTNFASQITRAAGITPQGDWYYNSSSDYGTTWVRADAFVKFWGTSFSTTSFTKLSQKVAKGNFIAHDSNSDGKFDHVGFVTDATTYSRTTNGVTYYDFKVAQHSNDYHLYVSDTRNGWEELSGIKVIINEPCILDE